MKLCRWCSSLMWYVRNFCNLVHVNQQLIVYHSNKCHQEARWYMRVFLGLWCGPLVLNMWCGRKVMRLAMLCTNRQRCCLPLHVAVRLTPAIDSVQVWTCYSCYVIVENIWSEVVFVRCVMKMDRQKFEQCCAIKFCVKLGESTTATNKIYKGLMENIPYPGHKCSDGTSPF